jgi:Ca-activated chloride channel family protein
MNRTFTTHATLPIAASIAIALAGCAATTAKEAPRAWTAPGSPAASLDSEIPAGEQQLAPDSAPQPAGEKKSRVAIAVEKSVAAEAAEEELVEDDAMVATNPTASFDREAYDRIHESPFLTVRDQPLSTFSIDVDTASYSNVRRFLTQGSRPPAGAVRVEELINYFDYSYPDPQGKSPFSVVTEVSDTPWSSNHRLVHIGVQGQRVAPGQMPKKNLVFLLDVSGSMNDKNKLPLLKKGMNELVQQLGAHDRVSIVVYAGASGLVLPPTPGNRKRQILRAMNRLEAGGSTNGGQGIELAYQVARKHYQPGAINRVILATDGDFNVGTTSQSELVRLIEEEREGGVFLTVLGFGMGNYQDSTLEKLADHGNGNYAYIDTFREAQKVLVNDLSATLMTIAKDVKIQVEFNPSLVGAYRLIGYENRHLADRDFNDDTKDAGEIGAGHSVTALYEVVPVGVPIPTSDVDALKYQTPRAPSAAAATGELMTVKLRYKPPTGSKSQLVSVPVQDHRTPLARTTDDFRFSAAVAAFGMLLRDSEHRGDASYEMVRGLARGAQGHDPFGYRREFVGLVSKAARL